jgi:uncharacterized protein (TIGR03083 family)
MGVSERSEPPVSEEEALLALDALEPDEQADAELRLGTFAAALAMRADALAEAVASSPPDDLRAEVLAGALARRAGGRPADRPEAAQPVEAFRQTVDDLHALLRELSPAEWLRQAHADHGRVRDVVAHLVGVEELALGWVGDQSPDGSDAGVDHVAATRGAVEALADEPVEALVVRWYGLARELADASAAAPPDRPLLAHDLPTDVEGLMLLRTFELWAHTQDICAATARPRPELDTARMALMSARLVAALPFAMALRGTSRSGRSVHLVLSGAAGGSYLVPLAAGEDPGVPEATIVTDVVDLCRAAARRLPLDELTAVVDGDRELAGLVLASADAFARD